MTHCLRCDISKFLAMRAMLLATFTGSLCLATMARGDEPSGSLLLHTRYREPAGEGFVIGEKLVRWDPRKTAVVICDMWDRHWCQGATRRVAEMVPRMNQVTAAARAQGMLVLHCPSDTMKFYQDAPQR